MDINKFFQSNLFKIGAKILIGLVILSFVFKAGMLVGFRKANFSFEWGENYHRNFGGPRGGLFGNFRDMMGKDFVGGNGAAGQIIKIEGPNLTVKGQDNVEKIIVTTASTTIRRFNDTILVGDLKPDEYVVTIGSPSASGQIEAKFIRVLPPPSRKSPMMRSFNDRW